MTYVFCGAAFNGARLGISQINHGATRRASNCFTLWNIRVMLDILSFHPVHINFYTRKGDVSSHIAEHHRLTSHTFDQDFAHCLTYSSDYFQRLTLESWLTNLKQTQLLTAPCKRLIHDINIRNEPSRRTQLYQRIETDQSRPSYAIWVLQPIKLWKNWPISL